MRKNKFTIDFVSCFYSELIPKLKIASLNIVFWILIWAFDPEK